MYDKTISAQRAIQRSSSKINTNTDVPQTQEPVVTDNTQAEEIAAQISADKPVSDFSSVVSELIGQFPNTAQNKPAPTVPKAQTVPQAVPRAQTVPTAPAVPRAQMRKQGEEDISSLMSEYVKIMNDQDDTDEKTARRGFRRFKKEKRKDEEQSPNLIEEKEPLFAQPLYETEVQPEEWYEAEQTSAQQEQTEDYSIKANDDFVGFGSLSEDTDGSSDADEYGTKEEISFDELMQEATEEEPKKEKKKKERPKKIKKEKSGKGSKGRIAARVLLSILLAVSLAATLAVGSINSLLNVNTGKEAFDKYYFFTSSNEFSQVGISSGDFVVCERRSTLENGAKAVYVNFESGIFSFGIKTDGKAGSDIDDVIYVISGNEVDRADVLGSVEKVVPMLGTVVSLVLSYYIPLLGGLAALCIALLLIIVFALRKKSDDVVEYEEEQEKSEEAYEDENSQSPQSDEPDSEFGADLFGDLN